jgi:hypothetical protein
MQLQSQNRSRRRGAILTDLGLRKLNQAKAEVEVGQNFKRCTLESLSERTGLTPNTLSKVFTRSEGVDKRTLECCFDAFNRTLLPDDYLHPELCQDNLTKIGSESSDPVELAWNSPLETLTLSENRSLRPNVSQPHNKNRFAQEQQRRMPDDRLCPLLSTLGGPMPLDSVFYIDHPLVKASCNESIQEPGALLKIRAPKQMGKTSLMNRILADASALGYYTVSLNLQLADAEILQNLERFLQWFCARVSKQLDLPQPVVSIADFWDHSLGSKSNITDYFEEILLTNLDHQPLVIAIDELNQLFAYPEIVSEFLQLLRTWLGKAKEGDVAGNPWVNLRLITVHSTQILMPSSIDPSILNLGLVVELPEFTLAQVQDLACRYEQKIATPQIQNLIDLLGGQPYRLQLAFHHLQRQIITLNQLLENSALTFAIYAEHLQQQWWNLQHYPELWGSLTEIVMHSNSVDCAAEPGSQLCKMGLVHVCGSQASLSCELFRPFFRDRLQEPRFSKEKALPMIIASQPEQP